MINLKSPTFKQEVQYELAKLGIPQKEMGDEIGLTESYLSSVLSFIRGPKTITYREEIIDYIERKKAVNEVIESRCAVNE